MDSAAVQAPASQLLQPIFDAGRNAAAYRSAQLAREAAVAQYERVLQAAFREVADALAGRATLTAQRDAQRDQVRAEQDRRERVELRYRHGASSHLELLDAERSLFAARQALVQAEVATSLNAVALYRVLGGGWQAMP